MKKDEFLKKVDDYAKELEGHEKFFRSLKKQTEEFRKQADKKIPNVEPTYKKEVKQVLKKILVEKNAENLKKLLME